MTERASDLVQGKGGGKSRISEKRSKSRWGGRNRNAIERMFCRLKDFRRLATRNERNATNFLAAVCIAETAFYWI
jgi:transposase